MARYDDEVSRNDQIPGSDTLPDPETFFKESENTYRPELSLAGDEPEEDDKPVPEPEEENKTELELADDEPEEDIKPMLELATDEPEEDVKPTLELTSDEPEQVYRPELELSDDSAEDFNPKPELSGEDSSEYPKPGKDDGFTENHKTDDDNFGGESEDNEGSAGDAVPGDTFSEPVNASGGSNDGSSPETPPKKKRKRYIIPLTLIIIFASAVTFAYQYANALNRPRVAVMSFIATAAELDFDALEGMTQSSDMSALDGTDLMLPVFHDFFLENNRKLTYEVANTRLKIGDGTSQVTVHLKYLDNTEVYRAALSELLRQVVEKDISEDFSGNTEVQQTILSLLKEKSSELEESYIETDVVYNLVKLDNEWKLVALDRETVRAITANCTSVQQEIDRLQAGGSQDIDNRYLEEDANAGSFNLDTEDYAIAYASHEISTDYAGDPCLLLFYDYTNKSEYPSGALIDVSITVFQHGEACDPAIPAANINETDSFLKEVKPGETLRVCQAFALSDLSDVTVQSYDGVRVTDGNINSVVIHLQNETPQQ